MELTNRQKDLFEFVKDYHGDQKRKYTNEPYWHHLLSVAEIASEHLKEFGVIEIALCHDLLEDTDCTWDLLHEALEGLGYSYDDATQIADGVHFLTDSYTKERYPDINRRERKKLEAVRLGQIPFVCQSVKYADLIDNTSSIVDYDPAFAKTYLKEKRDILNQMRKGNIDLLIECCYVLRSAEEKLITSPSESV